MAVGELCIAVYVTVAFQLDIDVYVCVCVCLFVLLHGKGTVDYFLHHKNCIRFRSYIQIPYSYSHYPTI